VIDFKKSENPHFPGKAEWVRRVQDGQATAEIGCPWCGHFGSLQHHAIASDGTVTPSLVCPWAKENGCTFHDNGRLAGWAG